MVGSILIVSILLPAKLWLRWQPRIVLMWITLWLRLVLRLRVGARRRGMFALVICMPLRGIFRSIHGCWRFWSRWIMASRFGRRETWIFLWWRVISTIMRVGRN